MALPWMRSWAAAAALSTIQEVAVDWNGCIADPDSSTTVQGWVIRGRTLRVRAEAGGEGFFFDRTYTWDDIDAAHGRVVLPPDAASCRINANPTAGPGYVGASVET